MKEKTKSVEHIKRRRNRKKTMKELNKQTEKEDHTNKMED